MTQPPSYPSLRAGAALRGLGIVGLLAAASCGSANVPPAPFRVVLDPNGGATRPEIGRREFAVGSELFPSGDLQVPSRACLGTSYDPGLVERWALARARLLRARGYSWVLVPPRGFIDEAKSDRAMRAACVRAVRDAKLVPVLDLREPGAAALASSETLDGIEHVFVVGAAQSSRPSALAACVLAFTSGRVEAIAGSTRALQEASARVAALAGDLRAASEAELALDRIRHEVAERSFICLRDDDYELDRDIPWRLVVDSAKPWIEARRENGTRAITLLASPHNANDLIREAGSKRCILATFDRGEHTIRALRAILSGTVTIRGRLPLGLGSWPRGAGITIPSRVAARPRTQRMETRESTRLCFTEGFERDLDRYVRGAIGTRIFPACQIAISLRGELAFSRSYGRETYAPGAKRVTEAHLFDLASVTKVATSTAVAMKLHEGGKLRLDAPIYSILPMCPELGTGTKRAITLEMLLSHSSGMAPWKRLWKTASNPDEVLRVACREDLRFRPGSSFAYSDLGMIVFGKCLEALGALPLDELARTQIYAPLGMRSTRFGPIPARVAVVPTEDEPGRGGVIRGRVHDENAEALDGIAGHAGLFSTARDLVRFGRSIAAGGEGLYLRSTVDRFCAKSSTVLESTRALGFDTPSSSNSAGRKLSASSIGHTGFTGTSLWIDRQRELVIACLTNRIHPSRNEPRIHSFRRNLHDLVVAELRADPAPRRRGGKGK